MTILVEPLIKSARACCTKESWRHFVQKHRQDILGCADPKLTSELFKILKEDPQSVHYDLELWADLLSACLTSWNLEVGNQILSHINKSAHKLLAPAACQILLESGKPKKAREIANRALKGEQLDHKTKLSLQLVIATSYSETGRPSKALSTLEEIKGSGILTDITLEDRAMFFECSGRISFFIGRYSQAAVLFKEAAEIFIQIGNMDSAAKAFFNAAACFDNCGAVDHPRALELLARCRNLAETYGLDGQLAHCEAFLGLDAFYRGNYTEAKTLFKSALNLLPITDQGFRRLHPLSMLSLTYFAMGRYTIGKKVGTETLELASKDESEIFKSRYQCIKAEVLWENGEIEQSHQVLYDSVCRLPDAAVGSLEDLYTLAKINLQSALCGFTQVRQPAINATFKRDHFAWHHYLYSLGMLQLSQKKLAEAEQTLMAIYHWAERHEAAPLMASCLSGRISCAMGAWRTNDAEELTHELSQLLQKLKESVLRPKLLAHYAGISYQRGSFSEALRLLRHAEKDPKTGYVDRFCFQSCIATMTGYSPKLFYPWQQAAVAQFVQGFFAPKIQFEEQGRRIIVSHHYVVLLDRHQILYDLISYLHQSNQTSVMIEDLQKDVWKESLKTVGWQQKIRNTLMRLRQMIPFTIAPLILHLDKIRIFSEAFQFPNASPSTGASDLTQILLGTLKEGPLSSHEISEKLHLSLSTTKRLLKKLADDHALSSVKEGRRVQYSLPLLPGGANLERDLPTL